jgi:group I intron endonuclease
VITNRISGHIYVGSSQDIPKRWAKHRTQLAKGTHCNVHLLNAYRLYGADAFVYKVLLYCSSEHLVMFEQKAFGLLGPGDYNMKPVAGSNRGFKHSKESRARMSLARKGLPSARKGQAITEEHRLRISENRKGIEVSEAARQRMSLERSQRKYSQEVKDMRRRLKLEWWAAKKAELEKLEKLKK